MNGDFDPHFCEFIDELEKKLATNEESFLWVEKYRPTKVEDCILTDEIREAVNGFVEKNEIPHLIFTGGAGVGKTSVAKAICSQIGADLMYINASNESGIDTIRNKVTQYASTVSMDGNLKVILLDECDGMSPQAQGTLRATQELFHASTRFIMTANFKNKLIDPLISRSVVLDFKIANEQKAALSLKFFKRVCKILEKENVEFDKKVVASLVQKYFPDFRKTLNELQRYSVNGVVDSGIFIDPSSSYDTLISSIKNKKFSEIRSWVARNADLDPAGIFRYFYDNSTNLFEGSSIPEMIILTASYQDMSSRVVDQEINTMAYLIEILSSAKWKQ